MVLLYDGITKANLDKRLWLAVRWPKSYKPEQTKIYMADGRMIHVLTTQMQARLAEQDALRKELGLPLIGKLESLPDVELNLPRVNPYYPEGTLSSFGQGSRENEPQKQSAAEVQQQP